MFEQYAETKALYYSRRWKNCRNAYAKSVGNLCECCLKKGLYVPGVIVHHKIHIDKGNMWDEGITMNWDNLELLCRQCHADHHEGIYGPKRKNKKRFAYDADGNLLIKQDKV